VEGNAVERMIYFLELKKCLACMSDKQSRIRFAISTSFSISIIEHIAGKVTSNRQSLDTCTNQSPSLTVKSPSEAMVLLGAERSGAS